MVKNSSLRNRASNLSLRVEPSTESTSLSSPLEMPHQVLGNKSIPTNTDSAASFEETRTEATVPEDVRPVRVHFPRPPPLPALLLDRNAPSKPQPLSDMDSQIQPSGLYLPPPPRWPPPEFEGLDTKIKLRRLERSLALE